MRTESLFPWSTPQHFSGFLLLLTQSQGPWWRRYPSACPRSRPSLCTPSELPPVVVSRALLPPGLRAHWHFLQGHGVGAPVSQAAQPCPISQYCPLHTACLGGVQSCQPLLPLAGFSLPLESSSS